ncbi:MAG: hypothetical protein ABL930_05795 [Pseudobdellovibrio sp.]
MKTFIFSLVFSISLFAAQNAKNLDILKMNNKFNGLILVTTDNNWKNKWETSSDEIPKFNETKKIKKGQHLSILTFFSNPKVNQSVADIICDIQLVKPNGEYEVNEKNVTCFKGTLKGPTHNVYLAGPVLEFVGEKSDPKGKWVINITLKDNIGNASVSLKSSFELK